MEELIKTGELMSNVFFNWSQDDKRFTPDERSMMRNLQRQWDLARSKVKIVSKPGSYKRARGVLKSK